MSDMQKQREHDYVDDRCTKCGQGRRSGDFMDRMFGRSLKCPTLEHQEELKVYYEAVAMPRQLGEDWTEETPLPQILADVNKAMEAKWQSQGYTRKVTITIPASKIDWLKNRQVPGGPWPRPLTCWDYINMNNLLACTGYEWEILPRYSFKDVKGMVDASWIGKKAQESGDKLKAEFRAYCAKNITRLIHERKPDKIDECHFCGCIIPSEEELNHQWNSSIPRATVKIPMPKGIQPPPSEATLEAYGRYNPLTATGEDLDRILSIWELPAVERADGETDESLRNRALAAHREKHGAPTAIAAKAETPITRYSRDYEGMYGDPEGEYVEYADHMKEMAAKDARIAELEGKATRWADNAVAKGAEIERLKDQIGRMNGDGE